MTIKFARITLEWAKTMTWKGLHPVVNLIDTTYAKGIKIGKKLFKGYFRQSLDRHVSATIQILLTILYPLVN